MGKKGNLIIGAVISIIISGGIIIATMLMDDNNNSNEEFGLNNLKYGMKIKDISRIIGDLGPDVGGGIQSFYQVIDGRVTILDFDLYEDKLMGISIKEGNKQWEKVSLDEPISRIEFVSDDMGIFGCSIDVIKEHEGKYTIEINDFEHKPLQSIQMEMSLYRGIELADVNSDGYKDMVVNIDGILNENKIYNRACELFIWDNTYGKYVKAVLEGFDTLSFFEIHDGYLINWIMETKAYANMQKLVWSGNILRFESEEIFKRTD